MSDAIKGSKSFLYSKEAVPGVENSTDTFQHLTVQEITGKRGAADTIMHGVTTVSTGNIVEVGSVRKLIKSTAHGAKQGWFMRLTSGASAGEEIAIVLVIDADSFVISALFPISIADTFDIVKAITPNYDSSGNLIITPPVGGATAANQVLEIAELTAISSRTIVSNLFTLYTGVNPATWTQLIASTPDIIKHITWFESGGFPMQVAIGASGSEVPLFYVPPGGFNGEIPFPIPSGSRVSIKQLTSDTLNVTNYIVANFLK